MGQLDTPEERADKEVTVKQAGDLIDKYRKIIQPAWALFIAVLMIGVVVGKFYYEWDDASKHGSPYMQGVLDKLDKSQAEQSLINQKVLIGLDTVTTRASSQQAQIDRMAGDIQDLKDKLSGYKK